MAKFKVLNRGTFLCEDAELTLPIKYMQKDGAMYYMGTPTEGTVVEGTVTDNGKSAKVTWGWLKDKYFPLKNLQEVDGSTSVTTNPATHSGAVDVTVEEATSDGSVVIESGSGKSLNLDAVKQEKASVSRVMVIGAVAMAVGTLLNVIL